MRLQLSFWPVGNLRLPGTLLEADNYEVDPRTGWLTISKIRDGKFIVIGRWAPGVIRSCIDVGEMAAAMVPRENPPERPEEV